MTAPRAVKRCNSCGEHKSRDEFPAPRSMKCSECHVSRVCIRCGARKGVEHFPLAMGAKHRGTENRIKRCHPCYLTDKRKKYSATERHQIIKWKYGITIEQRDAMLAAQGSRCAICRTPDPGGRGDWCIDHDHACCPGKKSCGGCVRGLLCFSCNVMLGCAKDEPTTLVSAVEYLQSTVSRQQPI